MKSFQFLTFKFVCADFGFRRVGQCRARKSIHPTQHPLRLFLFFLAFSFVLFLPSGLLGVIQARLVNARPAPPLHPLHLSFLSLLFRLSCSFLQAS